MLEERQQFRQELTSSSQVVLVVRNPPANAGDARDVGSILGSEDSRKEGMTTHSSILSWRIPCTEETGGLQSIGLQTVGHDRESEINSLHYL